MAARKSNQDKQVPWTKEKIGEAVYPPGFDKNIHIFWGPGQTTNQPETEYNPPDRKEWHNYEPLTIPQVIRFIHSSSDSYDSDSFPPPGGGAPHDIYYKIINTTDHIPPFPSDCIIYMQKFQDASPIEPALGFSVRKFALDPITHALLPVFGQYSIGMKFHFLFPAAPPIDWLYQVADGAATDGFYTRTGGILVVPF